MMNVLTDIFGGALILWPHIVELMFCVSSVQPKVNKVVIIIHAA